MFLFNLLLLSSPTDPEYPFYCPQTTPDLTITYVINYSWGDVNYCPQTIPDYAFAQAP